MTCVMFLEVFGDDEACVGFEVMTVLITLAWTLGMVSTASPSHSIYT
jgi:hypothetical protein